MQAALWLGPEKSMEWKRDIGKEAGTTVLGARNPRQRRLELPRKYDTSGWGEIKTESDLVAFAKKNLNIAPQVFVNTLEPSCAVFVLTKTPRARLRA